MRERRKKDEKSACGMGKGSTFAPAKREGKARL
jgi:hypothetical protein